MDAATDTAQRHRLLNSATAPDARQTAASVGCERYDPMSISATHASVQALARCVDDPLQQHFQHLDGLTQWLEV
jgi:hypothetical protein